MQVSNISLMTSQDDCQLQAEVRTAQDAEPFLLWYRFPADWAKYIDANNGDPFVLALLLPAMQADETLEIPVPISPQLACSVPELAALYQVWDPMLTQVPVNAPVRREDFHALSLPSRVGLFFSLGVDSFYSLLINTALHSNDDEMITDLITVNGFDISPGRGNARIFPTVLENCCKVGRALGKNVLPVTTNIRELGDLYRLDWAFYHGAAIASVGLALEGAFRRLRCADSPHYASLYLHGTNPLFAPLWSTERLTFVIDGNTTKLAKIRYFASSELAQEMLRVCWENPDGAYNCGRCGKCLLTMIGLHIAGVLPKFKTFPSSVDIALIPAQVGTSEDIRLVWGHLIGGLGTSETDLQIKVALESRLGKDQTSKPSSGNKALTIHTDEVKSLMAQLSTQTHKVNKLVAQISERQQAIESLAAQLAEKEQTVQELSRSLNMTYGSKLWRVGMLYHSVKEHVRSILKPKRDAGSSDRKG